MAEKISRRKLAAYVADRLTAGDSPQPVLRELAAYLIDSRRQREYQLVVRDIEAALLTRGTAIAETVSARPLAAEAKKAIEALVKSEYTTVTAVNIKETVDKSVLGGVKLVLPDKQLDATASAKLEKLGVR